MGLSISLKFDLQGRLAVRQYGYRPSLKSRLISFAQTILMEVLPSSLVFPLYTFLRRTGIKTSLDSLSLRLASN